MRLALALLVVGCRSPSEAARDRSPPAPAPTGSTPSPTLPTTPTPGGLAFTSAAAALSEVVGTIVVVSWEQSDAATVHAEFSADAGATFASSPARALEAGAHEELLLGIPYDTDVVWRLVAEGGSGTVATPDASIRTSSPPDRLPVPRLEVSDPGRTDPTLRWFLTSMNGTGTGADPYFSFVVDREGRIVWALPTPAERVTLHPRLGLDGASMLLDHNSYWAIFDGGAGSTVHRYTIDGAEVESFATPGLHHPFTELPDGTLAYGRTLQGYQNEFLQLNHPDGTSEAAWDCEAFLSQIGENGYCGSNTLSYDAATDRFLFSFYSFESIVEIDGTTGEAARWFGQLDGSWAFDPPESAFWWQHGGNWTADGTLLTSSYLQPSGGETVVREYAPDEVTGTLIEVASFGIGTGVFGAFMGEAHRLANGNTLQNTGSNARIREFAPDGTVVWEVAWGQGHEIGRSVGFADLYALAPDRP